MWLFKIKTDNTPKPWGLSVLLSVIRGKALKSLKGYGPWRYEGMKCIYPELNHLMKMNKTKTQFLTLRADSMPDFPHLRKKNKLVQNLLLPNKYLLESKLQHNFKAINPKKREACLALRSYSSNTESGIKSTSSTCL